MSQSTVEVGDVFYRSWGYDQTNVDFYEVVGITKSGKSVKLVRVGKTLSENDRGVVPTKSRVKGAWVKTSDGCDSEYDREAMPVFTRPIKRYSHSQAMVPLDGDILFFHVPGTAHFDTTALGYPGH